MLDRALFISLLVAFLTIQTRIVLDAQASVVEPSDFNKVDDKTLNTSSSQETTTNSSENDFKFRQLSEEDDIDVDGPYGYVPRVVHGVRKIVKGLLNGSVHTVFHGAFGIAPDDIADDLIETYNRIFAIPDPEDLEDLPKRKSKPSTTAKPKDEGNSTSGDSTAQPTTNSKKNKKGTKSKVDEDEDNDDDDDDDLEEED